MRGNVIRRCFVKSKRLGCVQSDLEATSFARFDGVYPFLANPPAVCTKNWICNSGEVFSLGYQRRRLLTAQSEIIAGVVAKSE